MQLNIYIALAKINTRNWLKTLRIIDLQLQIKVFIIEVINNRSIYIKTASFVLLINPHFVRS